MMASIKETRDAIRALPGMTALHVDGEWRVTINLYRLPERYPNKGTAWYEEKQEAMAYYTEDAEDAITTARDMSRRWEEGLNMTNKEKAVPVRERVYDIPSGYRDSAETMYGRLRHQGFSPEWDLGQRGGIQMLGITIPQGEVEALRELQKTNPATWGNHPDVNQMLDENKQQMEAASVHRRARLDALTPEQREFIEVLHRQSMERLGVDAALDVNDRLHELAAQHFRLAHINVREGLSKAQERVQEDVENKIFLLAHEIPGVLEPKFIYDPRGTTVGLMFESGIGNSMNGSYKVPLNPERVKELAHENFQAAIEALERADQERGPVRYMVLTIENTTNAAFVDTGREQEVARIIEEAADKMDDWWSQDDGERHPLRDLNGNTVGRLTLTSDKDATRQATKEGEVKLTFWCELDNDAYGDDPAHEAAQHLREAAHQITKGNTDFPVYDTNGNHIGDGTIRELPSLEKEGVIDMKAALGDVYLADDGYSGIADGAYRYVVPTNGFEPGYRQGEGDAWLVNAKGEKAPGYEEPQTVRETDFRQLKPDERAALRDVVEGRLTFEDFERRFDDADPAP